MKIQELSKKTSIVVLYYSYSEVLAATAERDAHPLDVSLMNFQYEEASLKSTQYYEIAISDESFLEGVAIFSQK